MTEKIPISKNIYAKCDDDGRLFFYIDQEAISAEMLVQIEEAFGRISVGDIELLRAIKDPFEQLDRLGAMVPAIAKALAEPVDA